MPIGPQQSSQVPVQGGPNQIPLSFHIDDHPMPHLSAPLPSFDYSEPHEDFYENDSGVVCPDILPVTTNLETHPLTEFNRQYGKLQLVTSPEDSVLFDIPTYKVDVQIPTAHLADTNILAPVEVSNVQVQTRPKPKARQGIALTMPLEDTLGKNPNRSNFLQESSTASLYIPSNPRKRSRNDGLDLSLSLMQEDCGKGKRVKRATARARGGQ